jgi:purine-binding chemotaxis protein CheW
METRGIERMGGEAKGLDRSSLAGKYLTFSLGRELYGVEILKVQEIIGILPITKVPKSPSYIKGVINLRGKVIPVIDLRLKLDMEAQEYDEKTCIIVVNMDIDQQKIAVGVVVDSVREVFNFAAEQIEFSPKFGMDVDSSSILGMGKINETVVMLLDISRALSCADNVLLDKTAAAMQ